MSVPLPVFLLVIADALVFASAITIGLRLSWATSEQILFLEEPIIWRILLYTSVNLFIFMILGVFRRQTLTKLKSLSIIIIIGFVFSIVIHTLIFYVIPDFRIWLSAFSLASLISLFGMFGIHFVFDRFITYRRFHRRILVLGAGKSASRIADLANLGLAPMIHCVGFIPIESDDVKVPDQDLLQSPKSLADQVLEHDVDEVVVALEERRNSLPVDVLLGLRLDGVRITNISTFLEREEGRVDLETLHPSWMIFSTGFSAVTRVQRAMKRAFDILASLIIIAITAPLYTLAALALLSEGSGPVLYRQERIGLNGRSFELIKFRSMWTDAEIDGVARWAELNDPRITFVGRILRRTRIDELPQIWNVLSGKMSLVGPRPERPEIVSQLKAHIPYYDYRHTVKPGISGWAQINFPYGASLDDSKQKLKYDLYYIKNYSIFLDMLVILLTLPVILWPEMRRQALGLCDSKQVRNLTELDQVPAESQSLVFRSQADRAQVARGAERPP